MDGPANIIWNGPRVFTPETTGPTSIAWSGPRVALSENAGGTGAPGAIPDEAPNSNGEFMPFGEDGLTFLDLLDVINPLQHIPIISTLYRHLTGDELSPAARIAGGALFGGPIGAAISVANVIVEYTSGKDVGEHVLSLFVDESAAGTLTAATDGALKAAGRGGLPEIVWDGPRISAADTAGPTSIAWNAPRLSSGVQAALLPLQNPGAIPPAPLAMAKETVSTPKAAFRGSITGTARPAPPQPSPANVFADDTADVFAAVRHQAAARRPGGPRGEGLSALPSTPGATPANGGWVSASIMSALGKYQQGAKLAERPQAPAFNYSN